MWRGEGVERDIYFKKLAHTIVGLANLQSVGQAGRLEIQVRVNVTLNPKTRNVSRISMLHSEG